MTLTRIEQAANLVAAGHASVALLNAEFERAANDIKRTYRRPDKPIITDVTPAWFYRRHETRKKK